MEMKIETGDVAEKKSQNADGGREEMDDMRK